MKNKVIKPGIILIPLLLICSFNQEKLFLPKSRSINPKFLSVAKRLTQAYPDFISSYTDSSIIWKDGYEMLLDDKIKNKNFDSLLSFPDIEDQFFFEYKAGQLDIPPPMNHDPGRVRYEPFFMRMYGETREEVEKNLVEIAWLPKSYNKKILISKLNGIDKKLTLISEELEKETELIKYLINIGGTFNWRTISGVNRLSTHSFGIALDINVNFSNYWRWDNKTQDDSKKIEYKNRIPVKIVEIFEKYGFIWGGKWYHYDTMHFEYRPELLLSE